MGNTEPNIPKMAQIPPSINHNISIVVVVFNIDYKTSSLLVHPGLKRILLKSIIVRLVTIFVLMLMKLYFRMSCFIHHRYELE